ncbi:unnamed protein product [Rotaria sp. Silwood1]|nr:unnamed protein product [Rotaria sp. Silwood1]
MVSSPGNSWCSEAHEQLLEDHFIDELGKSPKTNITKHSYHGNGKVQYEFCFNDEIKCLKVTERHIQTDDTFQLITHTCFQKELPDMFVSKHSHWMNIQTQIVEFRPIHFKELDFLDNRPYILSLKTGYVITTVENNAQILINQSSIFFQNLFNRYFSRLDDKPYVYTMRGNISQTDIIIHIHLSRLGIAFEYNASTNIIKTREYSDMCIDKDQWLGSLTGLTFGLLLSRLPTNNYRLDHYPYRKLIVPFGTVQTDRIKKVATGNNTDDVKRLEGLEITDYFKNQLSQSWNKFLSDSQYEKGYPSIKKIIQLLDSLRKESTNLWNELSNEQLFETGLILRITSTTLIPLLREKNSYVEKSLSFLLTNDQCTILSGIIVNWTLEQQLEKILHFAIHEKWEDFKKEISHIPHSN